MSYLTHSFVTELLVMVTDNSAFHPHRSYLSVAPTAR
jgi:hypothetical protein